MLGWPNGWRHDEDEKSYKVFLGRLLNYGACCTRRLLNYGACCTRRLLNYGACCTRKESSL